MVVRNRVLVAVSARGYLPALHCFVQLQESMLLSQICMAPKLGLYEFEERRGRTVALRSPPLPVGRLVKVHGTVAKEIGPWFSHPVARVAAKVKATATAATGAAAGRPGSAPTSTTASVSVATGTTATAAPKMASSSTEDGLEEHRRWPRSQPSGGTTGGASSTSQPASGGATGCASSSSQPAPGGAVLPTILYAPTVWRAASRS